MANLSPLASPTNLLQQTEDQIPSNLEGPFVNLLPPLLQEDYLLSLGEEEGISDLFDAYDLEKLPLVEDFMCSWLCFVNSPYKPIFFYYGTRTSVMQCCPFLPSSSKIVSWSKLHTSEQSWHFNEFFFNCLNAQLQAPLGKPCFAPGSQISWMSQQVRKCAIRCLSPVLFLPPSRIGLLCLTDGL